jgi:hypothetical protein
MLLFFPSEKQQLNWIDDMVMLCVAAPAASCHRSGASEAGHHD